jgi:hypothetical protein
MSQARQAETVVRRKEYTLAFMLGRTQTGKLLAVHCLAEQLELPAVKYS